MLISGLLYLTFGTNKNNNNNNNNNNNKRSKFDFTIDVHSSHPRRRFVVPFERRQPVAVHRGEGVDEMRAELKRDVLRLKLAVRCAILSPVRVVADTPIVALLSAASSDTCMRIGGKNIHGQTLRSVELQRSRERCVVIGANTA